MAQQQNSNTLADVIRLHQWCVGLDDDSDPEHLAAAARDAAEAGAVFAWRRGGAKGYKAWLGRLYPRLGSLALTRATCSDAWWWDESPDRATGLVLVEWRIIPSVDELPALAPLGFDYGDLLAGALRATGAPTVQRRYSVRGGGGRRPMPGGQ